jgi:hypothetical protein
MGISVQDLGKAIRLELEGVKRSLDSFEISPLGRERVMLIVNRFEAATEADLELYRTTHLDVRPSLQGRLDNLRDLPRAIHGAVDDAHNVKWLAEWFIEAEGDPQSGLRAALETTSQPDSGLVN